MKQTQKLRAFWSKKEDDIMLYFPLGYGTSNDGHYIAGIFDSKFEEEMKDRGYDIKTLRFSIEPTVGNPKFASQRDKQQP